LLPAWTPEDGHAIVGLGVVDLYHHLVRNHGLAMPEAEFLALCDRIASEIYGKRVTLAPGLRALLDDLAAKGVPVGLASSSPRPWVDAVLDRFGLRADFKAVATGDETPGRTKPAPDLYLLAAGRLGVEPGACVAVEDSRFGVQAAKAAGMRVLAYRSGDNDAQDLAAADAELRGFEAVDAGRLLLLAGSLA
ncbi:MAG: HAD-IA family hydrolase, partial [Elusimicrobia bacterium]|nr:HAD-IA family hydrolase [Elusimicrobiota bacterium]